MRNNGIVFNGGVPKSYGRIISRNIPAVRVRIGLKQAALADRMKALGFSWHPQTVGAVERGERRLTAEEVFGLAYALETSLAVLLDPPPDDKLAAFPSGQAVPAESIRRSLHYVNDGAVHWKDGKPEFSDGSMPEPGNVLRQVMAQALASLPAEQREEAAARVERISAAAGQQDVSALLAELPPEMRDILARLTGGG